MVHLVEKLSSGNTKNVKNSMIKSQKNDDEIDDPKGYFF